MTKKSKPKAKPAASGGDNPAPKSYEKVIARWTIVLGVSTVALVAATFISAYFLYRTDHTLKDQARTASEALIQSNRAFMSATGWRVRLVTEDGVKRYRFVVSWENTGNTPPRNLNLTITCPTSEGMVRDPEDAIELRKQFSAIQGIGAKQKADGPTCDLSVSDIGKLLSRKLSVYLLAYADYEDVFGQERVTEYCRDLSILGGKPGDEGTSGASFDASECDIHNCADEECPKQEREFKRKETYSGMRFPPRVRSRQPGDPEDR